jgi:hypothetical protein
MRGIGNTDEIFWRRWSFACIPDQHYTSSTCLVALWSVLVQIMMGWLTNPHSQLIPSHFHLSLSCLTVHFMNRQSSFRRQPWRRSDSFLRDCGNFWNVSWYLSRGYSCLIESPTRSNLDSWVHSCRFISTIHHLCQSKTNRSLFSQRYRDGTLQFNLSIHVNISEMSSMNKFRSSMDLLSLKGEAPKAQLSPSGLSHLEEY